MQQKEIKEQVICNLAELLRHAPFEIEHRVVKKPKGIKIIIEMTQEMIDEAIRNRKPS